MMRTCHAAAQVGGKVSCHSMRQGPVAETVVLMRSSVNICVLLDMHDLSDCHAAMPRLPCAVLHLCMCASACLNTVRCPL